MLREEGLIRRRRRSDYPRAMPPSVDDARAVLAVVLSSATFSRAPKQRRLLTHLVEKALVEGDVMALKEAVVASELFSVSPSELAENPIVRVQVGRLRKRLDRYYAGEGKGAAFRFVIPKGSYGPELVPFSPDQTERRRAYLQGRELWWRRTEADIRAALERFDTLSELDAADPRARSGHMDCLLALVLAGVAQPAERSRLLDLLATPAQGPELLASHGLAQGMLCADWHAAERALVASIAADPNYAPAHHWQAMVALLPRGRLREANAAMATAHDLAPLSLAVQTDRALLCGLAGEWDRARELCREVLTLDRHHFRALWYLGLAAVSEHRFEDAEQHLRSALAGLSGRSFRDHILAGLAACLARAGRRSEALAILVSHAWSDPFDETQVLVALGDMKRAAAAARRAVDRHSPFLFFAGGLPTVVPEGAADELRQVLLDAGIQPLWSTR